MKISLVTDIGQKRSNNQDFINKFDNKKGITLVILADGMGGHRAGNIASEMTVTDLGREWINTDYTELSQIRDWLLVTLEAENRKVYELGQTDEYKGMGTTVEALAIVDNNVIGTAIVIAVSERTMFLRADWLERVLHLSIYLVCVGCATAVCALSLSIAEG